MDIVKGKIGNALTSTAADHIVAVAHDLYDETQGMYLDDINEYLITKSEKLSDMLSCFSTGVWENDLGWGKAATWNNNKYEAIENLQSQIDTLAQRMSEDEEHLSESDNKFNKHVASNIEKFQEVDGRLDNSEERISELETLAQEHDTQIKDLLDGLSCFGDGQWNNQLKWSNSDKWENSNLMRDTFEDVYAKIEEHQQAIEQINAQIADIRRTSEETLNEINNTFDGFRNEHESFRQEHNAFKQEHEEFRSEHQAIRDSITEVVKDIENINDLDDEQQRQIDVLLYCLSVISNGVWDNNLLWVNNSEWSNKKTDGSVCDCPDDTEETLEWLKEQVNAINDGSIPSLKEIINKNENDIADTNNRIDTLSEDLSSVSESVDKNASDIAGNLTAIQENTSLIQENADDISELSEKHITDIRGIKSSIRAIQRKDVDQDETISKIGEHFSCYADGLWGDWFLWDNELLWNNDTNGILSCRGSLENYLNDLSTKVDNNKNECDSKSESLGNSIKEIVEYDSDQDKLIRQNSDNIESNKEQIDQIGSHFSAYADGIWSNPFLWSNELLWRNNSEGVLSCKESLENYLDDLNNKVEDNAQSIQALDVLAQDIIAHNDEQDNKIEQNSNDIIANKEAIDSNTSLILNNSESIDNTNEKLATLEEKEKSVESDVETIHGDIKTINKQLKTFTKEQEAQDDKVTQIAEHFSCYADGLWGDWFLWSNDDVWANNEDVLSETINDIQGSVSSNEGKIAELEAAIASLMNLITSQQKQLDEHQKNLDSIMIYFTVLSVGAWNNGLLWDNDAEWSNASLQEQIDESSSVTVKAYDEETETVVLDSVEHSYDEPTETLIFE